VSSTCPYLDHSVSGLIRGTHRPIQTWFPFAYTYRLKLAPQINSLTHYTKGTPSHLIGAPTVCRHPVSGTISLPLSGCFSPFPHGTCTLSVTKEYLGLEGGPPMFRQDFTCPALLVPHEFDFDYRAITYFGVAFHPLRLSLPHGLAWSDFARHYFRSLG
jgi:hypothetical protein